MFRRRKADRQELCVWTWSSYETASNSDVSLPHHELWTLQKHGDICIPPFSPYFPCCCSDVVQRAKPATKQEMCQFHSDDYIDFLSKVTPENMAAFSTQQTKCTILSLNPQAKYQLMWVMTVLCLTDFSSFAGFQGEGVWRVQHG